MRKMILNLSYIILTVLTTNCQSSKHQNKVDSIKHYVASLEKKTFQSKKIIFYDQYREQDAIILGNVADSEMKVYYERSELIILEVSYNGSHGDLKTSFYCKNGNLVFVKKQLETYFPPKHESGSKLLKSVVNEFYLDKKSIIAFEHEGGAIRFNKPYEIDTVEKFKELHQDYNMYVKILSNKE